MKNKFNKERFLKYRIIPLVMYILALTLSLLFIIVIADAKSIPDGLQLMIIITIIMMWAAAIDSNNDAHSREIKDILNKRLPESNADL